MMGLRRRKLVLRTALQAWSRQMARPGSHIPATKQAAEQAPGRRRIDQIILMLAALVEEGQQARRPHAAHGAALDDQGCLDWGIRIFVRCQICVITFPLPRVLLGKVAHFNRKQTQAEKLGEVAQGPAPYRNPPTASGSRREKTITSNQLRQTTPARIGG